MHPALLITRYVFASRAIHYTTISGIMCTYIMRVLNGQARYEIADTEYMGIFHAVLHYRIGKRTKKH